MTSRLGVKVDSVAQNSLLPNAVESLASACCKHGPSGNIQWHRVLGCSSLGLPPYGERGIVLGWFMLK